MSLARMRNGARSRRSTPARRRESILDLVQQDVRLRVDAIAERFGVSHETIRRDLAMLDARHLLRRVHGGAKPVRVGGEAPFERRAAENLDAKARIAHAAAALFEQGDTIMIDAGSTTEAFAAALAARGRFDVVTNSVKVAWRVHDVDGDTRLHLVGGEFRGRVGETVGSVATDSVARYRADHAVLTVSGIDAEGGCMDSDLEEAMVARTMVRQATRVTVVADRTKLGRVATYKVCDLSAVSRLVTDEAVLPCLAAALDAAGVETIVAGDH